MTLNRSCLVGLCALAFVALLVSGCGGGGGVDEGNGPGVPGEPFGTELGSYEGIVIHSNYTNDVQEPQEESDWGLKWQCVEYVNHFYNTFLGYQNMKGTGDAKDYYGNAPTLGLDAYENGGAEPPKVNDILCSEGGTNGHVAIVREVTDSAVHVIHQNFLNTIADEDLALPRFGDNNNTVRSFNRNGGYEIKGWLRKP